MNEWFKIFCCIGIYALVFSSGWICSHLYDKYLTKKYAKLRKKQFKKIGTIVKDICKENK